jgi:hypothetical protein
VTTHDLVWLIVGGIATAFFAGLGAWNAYQTIRDEKKPRP